MIPNNDKTLYAYFGDEDTGCHACVPIIAWDESGYPWCLGKTKLVLVKGPGYAYLGIGPMFEDMGDWEEVLPE